MDHYPEYEEKYERTSDFMYDNSKFYIILYKYEEKIYGFCSFIAVGQRVCTRFLCMITQVELLSVGC